MVTLFSRRNKPNKSQRKRKLAHKFSVENLEGREMLTTYSVVDLGLGISPSDINNLGVVVGTRVGATGTNEGITYDATNGVTAIPGTRDASAINNAGQIVGATTTGSGYLYDDGALLDLDTDHSARGISDTGLVAGSEAKDNPYRATPRPTDPAVYDISRRKWDVLDVAKVYPRGTRQGVYADLYRLQDVNDAGYAVGIKSRYGLVGSSSILTTPGVNEVIFLPIPTGGRATAINNNNLVVGSTNHSSTTGIYAHAYSYDYDNGAYTDLGTLGDGISSSAYDVNELGQIVGTSWMVTQATSLNDPSLYHGFIWQDGQLTDLNDQLQAGSDFLITSAQAINDAGYIAAVGISGGQQHGLILVPDDLPPPPPPVNDAPTAEITPSRTKGRAPLQVTFDASSSTDPDGNIVSFDWDFGDGTSDSGLKVTHSFYDAGVFTVGLTVTDAGGLADYASVDITVRAGRTNRTARAALAAAPAVVPASAISVSSLTSDSSSDRSSSDDVATTLDLDDLTTSDLDRDLDNDDDDFSHDETRVSSHEQREHEHDDDGDENEH
ncbi:MAG: DUF3466 family protein, partial [Planctomycetales bacterium]|nr:DUF3466 family protein [Planctomycetales bacterium]